jgi:hypothetical protein
VAGPAPHPPPPPPPRLAVRTPTDWICTVIMGADSCIRVQSVYIITPRAMMIGFGSEQSRAFTTWFVLTNRFFSSSARSGHLFLYACVGLRTKAQFICLIAIATMLKQWRMHHETLRATYPKHINMKRHLLTWK